jgi:hypothetical protein
MLVFGLGLLPKIRELSIECVHSETSSKGESPNINLKFVHLLAFVYDNKVGQSWVSKLLEKKLQSMFRTESKATCETILFMSPSR